MCSTLHKQQQQNLLKSYFQLRYGSLLLILRFGGSSELRVKGQHPWSFFALMLFSFTLHPLAAGAPSISYGWQEEKEESREGGSSPNGISLFIEIFLETYIQPRLLDTREVGNASHRHVAGQIKPQFSEEGKGRGWTLETPDVLCHVVLFSPPSSIAFPTVL